MVTSEGGFDPTPPPVLAVTPAEAAKMIGVSRSMFFKLLNAGRIGPMGTRLGRCHRFSVDELQRWVAAGMPRRELWMGSETVH